MEATNRLIYQSFIVVHQALLGQSVHWKPHLSFVEWLLLIEPVSVLSSNHIAIKISFGDPGLAIAESHASYETACSFFRFASSWNYHVMVEFCILRWQSCSISGSFSDSRRLEWISRVGRPRPWTSFHILIRMWLRYGLLSEFVITCCKRLVFSWGNPREVKACASIKERLLVHSVFGETSSGKSSESASELIIGDFSRHVALVARDCKSLVLYWRLSTHVIVVSSVHIIIGPS